MGESADHGLFLEVILPALEELGNRRDSRWEYPNCLWGKFDIDSVYMARGYLWEPLVRHGRLDLRYKATPRQWSEGLNLDMKHQQSSGTQVFDSLDWVMPFDFGGSGEENWLPTLKRILEAFIARAALLTMGTNYDLSAFWKSLSEEDRTSLENAVICASDNPVLKNNFSSVPEHWPGRRTGEQIFSASIADLIIPYLGLASIFHIGKYAHFGCGTFFIH